jgi:hypothetical protein
MNDATKGGFLEILFPRRRLAPDFPLPLWFAGLWLYLKAFLYFCYFYMLGLEPPPYPTEVMVEILYFGATFIPIFLMGVALWNDKRWILIPTIVFLFVDTPLLLYHVLRLAEGGFLDSLLTKILEIGSLVLNVAALGWLMGYRSLAAHRAAGASGPRR